MRMLRSLVAVAALGAAGCGGDGFGAGPGEFTVIRVAVEPEATYSGDCNPPDPTTIFHGGTVVVYGISSDAGPRVFLDAGADVFEGTKADDGSYTFAGSVQDQGNVDLDVTISLVPNGQTVSGTATYVYTGNSFACTVTADYTGVVLPDDTLSFSPDLDPTN